MEVSFVDNHLLIVMKPAGLLTQPDDTGGDNLLDIAKAWVKREFQKPGNVFLEPIHRLDKQVGGLVLFARTSKALSRLNQMMRERKIHKTYRALVEGEPAQTDGVLEHYLCHDNYRARVVSSHHSGAKLARLTYRHLAFTETQTLLEVQLETGRYHQIRAQFAAIGCPIVGDQKYGSTSRWKEGEIALHHTRLELTHPVSGVALVYVSPEPFKAHN